MKELLEKIKGQIISCQALEGEPMFEPDYTVMHLFARAAKMAGSPMIRTNSVRDITAIKKETGLPVIGIIKKQYEGFDSYITSTMVEIDALVQAEVDVIALDCTFSKRGDGKTINEFVKEIYAKYPDVHLMADISTYEEGENAEKMGVSLIGTTMNGYTPQSISANITNVELVKKFSTLLHTPIIAEGKVHTPMQAKEILEAGAHAVVVGGAITRPLEIATRFISEIKNLS